MNNDLESEVYDLGWACSKCGLEPQNRQGIVPALINRLLAGYRMLFLATVPNAH